MLTVDKMYRLSVLFFQLDITLIIIMINIYNGPQREQALVKPEAKQLQQRWQCNYV